VNDDVTVARGPFLRQASATSPGAAVVAPKPTDIRIDEVVHDYEDYVYRAPYKFGGRIVDRTTLLNVRCRVTTRNGQTAWGFASMTMGNMWAFPSATMTYDTTLEAMKALAARIARMAGDCPEIGHPLDIAHVLEPECLKAAAEVSAERKLTDPIPKLCTLVVASPFLLRIKIKLQGDDLSWDVGRTLAIDRIAVAAQGERRVADLAYCLDFNERCADVQYVLECLSVIRARSPEAFSRILYVEQPTARDLQVNRQNVMHEAARLCPVVIDESLTDLESLVLAREMGYTGVALKACKGQSQTVLMAAAAQKYKMFLCVQDLTCPGASLVHSVGISARVPAVAGIEANARQYVPAANEPWRHRFPGIFTITDGYIRTDEIGGPGLGIPDDMVPR
jgi:hypothetical protein